MNKKLKIFGIIYSVLSGLILPFLLFIQIFSVFLFDAPGSSGTLLPYLIALGIFLIPVSLIVSNILMWISIKKSDTKLMIIYMIIPIAYTILFFSIWSTLDKFP